MNEKEMLELLVLSIVVLPNMGGDYDRHAAAQRQLELFKKAAEPYSLYQDIEEVEPVTNK